MVTNSRGVGMIIDYFHVYFSMCGFQRSFQDSTFFITIILETVLWSGLKLGPPRRLKFPDPSSLVEALKVALA